MRLMSDSCLCATLARRSQPRSWLAFARGACACGLIWLASAAQATTLLGMDIDTLVADAELIFEGEVLERETRQDQNSGLIHTWVTFQVRDVVKGAFGGDTLELKFTGGNFNGRIVAVSGLVIPEIGEQGIYFVESLGTNMVNPLLGWSQGHYLIFDDNGERRVSTVDKRPVLDVQPVSGIPRAIRKPQVLIEGDTDAPTGVVTDTNALTLEGALSVDEFKSRIQSLTGN